jgi:hypothetical protein
MRRLSWVFITPPPIINSKADVNRAPKERKVDTILMVFQQTCNDDLSTRLNRPDVINVNGRKNQAKKYA